MQTRAATRKAAEVLKQNRQDASASRVTAPTSTTAEGPRLEAQVDPVPEDTSIIATATTPSAQSSTPPAIEDTSASASLAPATSHTATGKRAAQKQQTPPTPRIAASVPKRKRGKAAPRQPMKGGWVLPHGMGVSLEPMDASVPSVKREAGSGQHTQEDTPSVSAATLPAVDQEPKRASDKQTKLAFRVTKISVATKKQETLDAARTEDKPLPQKEELEASQLSIGRRRTRSVTARQADRLVTDDDEAEVKEEDLAERVDAAIPESTLVLKEENPVVIADAAAETSTRKLLVIKGVIIADGTPAKHGEKIVVDATQILDPDFRMILKRGLENKYGLTPGFSPYPYRRVPTPEDCEEVYRLLAGMHGECMPPKTMPAASLTVAGCGEVPCVLDALLRTLISGYTKMEHADQAIQNLVQHYGLRTTGTGKGSINWEKVRQSPHGELKKVVEIAGGGNQRAKYIKLTLDMVYEENLAKHGPTSDPNEDLLSLDYMHSMTKDEALAKFVSYPGIGIKTAACVTLFCLQIPCFAVDTHVHRVCRWLGWSAPKADPDNCFRHADHMVPDHLKYGLHQLFIRHGQLCFKCRAITKPGTKDWNEAPDCPLEHLLTRTKDGAASGKRKRDDGDGDSDADDEEDEPKAKAKKPRVRKAKAFDNLEDSETEVEENGPSDEDDDDHKPRVESVAKKLGPRAAKAVKSSVQDDSDTEMGGDDHEDQGQVEVKLEAKKPRNARPKPARRQSKVTRSNTDATRAKPRTARATRSKVISVVAEEHSDMDEDATEDEAHQSEMELDTITPVADTPSNAQNGTKSASKPSQIELEQPVGSALDIAVAQENGGSQNTTTSSPVLSELSYMSDLTDLSDLSDTEEGK
ncbi:hypothetical protein B0T14DRAFT_75154 [Immersiella caudata]|uniref:HhH-GPD domain-containing protein n=1 Tax=Immersiella caudata TaxID=314043 RepID=A0AA39XGJ5_9PEZI|nr:hypothetical protein B0T14DRAFT_75154 [Immersiella caudata]